MGGGAIEGKLGLSFGFGDDPELESESIYLESNPPSATFLTCTTLTPVSRAMAALLGSDSVRSFLISSKIVLFMEIVLRRPLAVVPESLSLNAGAAKGVNALIKSLTVLKSVPIFSLTDSCSLERYAALRSLLSRFSTSALARSCISLRICSGSLLKSTSKDILVIIRRVF